MSVVTMNCEKSAESIVARKFIDNVRGGGVTTQSFADEIGADGYSGDAAEAVHLVERLLNYGDR